MSVASLNLSAEELAEQFRYGFPKELPDNWANDEAVMEAHRILARECIANVPEFDDALSGRGIVICAGGHRHFTNGWVCMRTLRDRGCDLPIQFWHLGDSEMDETMRRIVAGFDVECVDAEHLRTFIPARILYGWELKPYALLNSPFREVLLLDADNVPVRDPSFLFDSAQYAEHGAVFWPDYGRLEPFRGIWSACEVEYRDEPEFESGQLIVDKLRCWPALHLAMHYNEHSDFYFQHVHGDKETYHLAFHRVGKSYAMPSRGIQSLDATMCQHDFDGHRVFQHRNMDKWLYDGSNRNVADFFFEDECREHLAELRTRWNGCVLWNDRPSRMEEQLILRMARTRWRYERVGYDHRELELCADRRVGFGSERCERAWTITSVGGEFSLVLFGEDGPTCRLTHFPDGWRGRWFRCERMPIVLSEIQPGA